MKSISRKQVGILITFGIFSAVAAYFLFQLRPVIEPPLLVVISPEQDTVMHASTTIILEGRVSPHADLAVNGRRVQSNNDGIFKTEWDLVLGLNRLDFYATNKFGKSTEVLRYILVK